tara:strand:- start:16330 stop:17421 length:1092 start_codon:yes stop_codon:yes gene_type:complete
MQFNKSILNLKPYVTSSHKAWESNKKDNVLKLDWNECAIGPSPKVKIEIEKFLNNGKINWYPDTLNKRLINQIAYYCNLNTENVDYYSSSDAIHEYLARLFLFEKSKVIILGPTYDNFRAVAESYGAEIFLINADAKDNFQPPLKKLIEAIENNNPNLVYLCNPNNPTGKVIPINFIKETISRFTNTAFIVDEAYFEFSNITASNYVNIKENLIITRTFSKAFGLASARIGYILANKIVIDLMRKIKNHKNISSFAQISALAALDDIPYMHNFLNIIDISRNFIINWANKRKLNLINGEGNFVLIEFGKNSDKLQIFLEDKNIYLRKYKHIKDMDNYIRVTLGTLDQMKILVEFCDQFLKNQE